MLLPRRRWRCGPSVFSARRAHGRIRLSYFQCCSLKWSSHCFLRVRSARVEGGRPSDSAADIFCIALVSILGRGLGSLPVEPVLLVARGAALLSDSAVSCGLLPTLTFDGHPALVYSPWFLFHHGDFQPVQPHNHAGLRGPCFQVSLQYPPPSPPSHHSLARPSSLTNRCHPCFFVHDSLPLSLPFLFLSLLPSRGCPRLPPVL